MRFSVSGCSSISFLSYNTPLLTNKVVELNLSWWTYMLLVTSQTGTKSLCLRGPQTAGPDFIFIDIRYSDYLVPKLLVLISMLQVTSHTGSKSLWLLVSQAASPDLNFACYQPKKASREYLVPPLPVLTSMLPMTSQRERAVTTWCPHYQSWLPCCQWPAKERELWLPGAPTASPDFHAASDQPKAEDGSASPPGSRTWILSIFFCFIET